MCDIDQDLLERAYMLVIAYEIELDYEIEWGPTEDDEWKDALISRRFEVKEWLGEVEDRLGLRK